MKVTLKDVADAAHLSVASVSRILTNRGRYSEVTAKRVRELAQKMGYYKNQNAADLSSKKSRAVGVVVPLIHTNFADEVIKGLYEATISSGYELLITYLDENEDHQYQVFQTLLSRQVGAVFMLSLDIPSWMVNTLLEEKISVISLTALLNDQVSAVTSDESEMMNTIIDYLVTMGHKNIALIGDTKLTTIISNTRRTNFIKLMHAHGLTDDNMFLYGTDHTYETGYNSVATVYDINHLPFTAAVATADLVGQGLANAMLDHDKKVPDDLSIVTIDGLQQTKIARPKLTTIQQNFPEIGRVSMQLFLTSDSVNKYPQVIYIPTELIQRDSVLNLNSKI